MKKPRAIELLKIERECVNRNNQPFGMNCSRECGKCDLAQNTEELLEMYDFVIEAMEYFEIHAHEVHSHISARDFICDRLEQLKEQK